MILFSWLWFMAYVAYPKGCCSTTHQELFDAEKSCASRSTSGPVQSLPRIHVRAALLFALVMFILFYSKCFRLLQNKFQKFETVILCAVLTLKSITRSSVPIILCSSVRWADVDDVRCGSVVGQLGVGRVVELVPGVCGCRRRGSSGQGRLYTRGVGTAARVDEAGKRSRKKEKCAGMVPRRHATSARGVCVACLGHAMDPFTKFKGPI